MREIVSLCAVPTPPPSLRDTSAGGGQKVVPLWRGQGEVIFDICFVYAKNVEPFGIKI